MNFEELYKKYREGTATEEEKAFVEGEIEKAKKISLLLGSEGTELEEATENEGITAEADEKEYKKAKKSFLRHSTVKVIVIALCCILGLALIVGGTFLGVSLYSASSSATITEKEAVELAKECVSRYCGIDASKLIHCDTEKELDTDIKLTNAKYVYEIEIMNGNCKFEVEVNSVSGYAHITDIDNKNRFCNGNGNNASGGGNGNGNNASGGGNGNGNNASGGGNGNGNNASGICRYNNSL